MARINTNIASLIAQRNLAESNADLGVRLQRLATGLRLNRGADDPAGLITSERVRSNLRGIEQGVRNAERASSVIATTEGSLTEVSELLNWIKSLVVEAANSGAFSAAELDANQRQIDSAIDSITRISNTASFADLKLLNGELGYTLSGVDSTEITKATVNAAQFLERSDIQVDVEVVEPGSETDKLFQVMERKLLRLIMNPAMTATWIFGLALVFTPGIVDWSEIWPWTKAVSVLAMTWFHHWLGYRRKEFIAGTNSRTGRTYRMMNEVPTVLMIVIVLSVIVKF